MVWIENVEGGVKPPVSKKNGNESKLSDPVLVVYKAWGESLDVLGEVWYSYKDKVFMEGDGFTTEVEDVIYWMPYPSPPENTNAI